MGEQTDLEQVIRLVEQRREAYVDRLADYVRLPSVSAVGGEPVRAAGVHIRDVLRAGGFAARLHETPGQPVVVAHRAGGRDRPRLVIYGHYDVQPPGEDELWDSPPFAPAVRDGRLYGRGTADNKGQHLAHVIATELLVELLGELPGPVSFVLEGEEETGSPHLDQAMRELAGELAADLVIVSDGPTGRADRFDLVYGLRGILAFELTATGADRDLHSGHYGEIPPNPLWTLVHLLASMKDEAGNITIDGFPEAAPLPERERAAVAALEPDVAALLASIGAPRLAPAPVAGVAPRQMARPTLTINGLHGGYGGPRNKTVLPHRAVAKCDIRLVDGQDADTAWELVQAHVRAHAPDVTASWHGAMHPSRTPMDTPYAAPVAGAIRAATGNEPVHRPTMGGSLPMWVFTRTLGLPALVLPLGNPDQANHAPNENLALDRFYQGIAVSAAVQLGLAGS